MRFRSSPAAIPREFLKLVIRVCVCSASAWGHVPVLQLLIERGAGFQLRNNAGWTASDLAFSFSVMNALQDHVRIVFEANKRERSARKQARRDKERAKAAAAAVAAESSNGNGRHKSTASASHQQQPDQQTSRHRGDSDASISNEIPQRTQRLDDSLLATGDSVGLGFVNPSASTPPISSSSTTLPAVPQRGMSLTANLASTSNGKGTISASTSSTSILSAASSNSSSSSSPRKKATASDATPRPSPLVIPSTTTASSGFSQQQQPSPSTNSLPSPIPLDFGAANNIARTRGTSTPTEQQQHQMPQYLDRPSRPVRSSSRSPQTHLNTSMTTNGLSSSNSSPSLHAQASGGTVTALGDQQQYASNGSIGRSRSGSGSMIRESEAPMVSPLKLRDRDRGEREGPAVPSKR